MGVMKQRVKRGGVTVWQAWSGLWGGLQSGLQMWAAGWATEWAAGLVTERAAEWAAGLVTERAADVGVVGAGSCGGARLTGALLEEKMDGAVGLEGAQQRRQTRAWEARLRAAGGC
eukprot:7028767-Prymnesium_polylepis.1